MPASGIPKKLFVFFLVLLSFCISGISQAASQRVKLPITLDYKLLQTLIIRSAYTEASQSATLLNKGNGCLYLALSNPTVSEANGAIRFETQISLHAGTPLGDQCAVPVAWQGYLVLYQRPVIDGRTWKLSFATTSSSLLEMNRQPARIAGAVWSLFKSQVFSYLESIKIDLAPPVNDLKTFLLPLFPQGVQQETQAMLRTLRTGETRVGSEAVTVEILADVREVYRPGDPRPTEVLTGKALDEMVGVWEQWDALLSFLVTSMSRNVLTEEERQTMMDVLLDTRYKFVEGLSNQKFTHDFVREQFVKAWRHLSPIFRNHLGQNPDDQSLGFLSFFTAADALSVLDGLGPTFGIEMSRDGLIRLARMLTKDPSILSYGSGVNLDLRKLFQLMPILQVEKTEPPEGSEGSPVFPEDRKDEESPVSPYGKRDQGGLIDQGNQSSPGDRGKSGTQVVPSEETTKYTPRNQGHKAIPNKPVERDIESDDHYKPGNEAKPSGQAGGKNTESQPTGPEVKGELGRLIDQIKQEAPEDQGTGGTQVIPTDETMKNNKPDRIDQQTPDKPIEQDIDIYDHNPQNKEKPLEKGGADNPADPNDKQTRANQVPFGAIFWDFLFAPVYAGEPVNHIDILQWKVPDNGVDQYVRKVVEVLNNASQTLANKGELPASMQGMFRSLITAMAWQESCFRQFVEKNNQMTYLLSYNNTSVGLMQVNERVWRGLYDRERLRWDIHYNAMAGSEIASLYLQKYALRDKNNAKKLDQATLARLVYAMYNGGPGQYQDFLERFRKGKMLTTDELFWEKYSWVTSGNWEKCSQCLN